MLSSGLVWNLPSAGFVPSDPTPTSNLSVRSHEALSPRDAFLQKLSSRAAERLRQRLAVARLEWGLSDRQHEVLELLVLGLSNKEIASQMRVSEPTIERHASALFRRADATCRSHLMARFWLELPELPSSTP